MVEEIIQLALVSSHDSLHSEGPEIGIFKKLGEAWPHSDLSDIDFNEKPTIWIRISGPIEINPLDFERWYVDSGPGPHLLIDIDKKNIYYEIEKYCIGTADPAMVNSYIGKLVREGWPIPQKTNMEKKEKKNNYSARKDLPKDVERLPTVLQPNYEVERKFKELDDSIVRPTLLLSRLWTISYLLKGPINEFEELCKKFVETNVNLPLLDYHEEMKGSWIPKLKIIEKKSMRSEKQFLSEVYGKLSERRVHDSKTDSNIGTATLLKWWHPEKKSINISWIEIKVPCWQIIREHKIEDFCGLSGKKIT